MNFPLVRVQYNRLKYQSKSGYSPVYLSIHYNGKTDYLRLPVPKIHKNDWIGDAVNGRWIKSEPLLDELISNELTKVRKFCTNEVLSGRPISVKSIKEYFDNPKKLESFNNFAKDFVRNINRNKHEDEKLAYRTVQAYKSFLVKLDDFEADIKFEQIGPELLSSFNDFLATKHNLKKTSRAKHFDKFNVIYDEAARKKLVEFLPGIFKGYKGRNKPQQIKLDIWRKSEGSLHLSSGTLGMNTIERFSVYNC